ncbi:MAG: MarR family transcriptional regulator [Verrucomicrobiaceae bacterium]|nr:MarR family transcriptional regulator [Verrucomicrobiaceae bacterium]
MLQRIVKTRDGIALGIGLLALSIISGCASYGDIHSDKKPRQVDSFATNESLKASLGDWPAQTWWTQFGDAQLDALISEALTQNPSLQIAAARMKSAQAYTGIARAALYPQVNASADVQYQHFSETWEIPPPFDGATVFNNQLQLSAGYEIDFWGKNRNAVKAALSSQQALEAEEASSRLLVTSSLTKSYIELFRLYELRDVVAQSLEQREKIFTLTQQRVDNGLDTRSDLKQAEAQLPAIRGQLAQIDESIGAMRNALAVLTGAGPDRGLQIARPQLTTPQIIAAQLPDNVPLDLLGRRPDIVASRWRVEAAQRETDVAKAEFYPNVNLNAAIGYTSFGLDNIARSNSLQYGIGPAVSLPIFVGGALRANLKQKYAGYEEAVAVYDQTLSTALRDVADQLNTYKWLQVRVREQQNALTVAREALALATQRYEAGLGNYLYVLNAETLVLTQEQLGTELTAGELAVRVNLIKALGGGFGASAPVAQASSSTAAVSAR